MEKTIKPIKMLYDQTARSLTVWFDDPKKEVVVEETGEEILVSKDKDGRTIGVEVLNFSFPTRSHKSLPVETAIV